jgi:hypothetical protein
MARIYKTVQVDGEDPVRKLAYIECDRCPSRIEPAPDIMHSGWMKEGIYYGPGDGRNHEADYCPRCR